MSIISTSWLIVNRLINLLRGQKVKIKANMKIYPKKCLKKKKRKLIKIVQK